MTQHNNTNKIANMLSGTSKKLLTTTAMTAVGLLAMSGNAKAADDFSDHVHVGGSAGSSLTVTVDIPTSTTNLKAVGSVVKAEGDGDLKAGWRANIDQDSSSAKYVLFDTEADPTYILGNLNANGQVFVFDQNGVIFGANSKVNVGSIVASSGELKSTNRQLDAGKVKIELDNTDGEVVNNGSITVAEGGLAAFVAPTITNNGVINAKMGNVVMASGEEVTLDLYGDGMVEVAVQGELAEGLIRNRGNITANGGNVLVSAAIAKTAVDNVINMDGIVDVSSVSVKGGKIVLSGGSKGTVKVSGKLKASGTTGGDINVTGENINVADTSELRADGGLGDSQEGNGGRIDVIAQRHTDFRGRLIARGGALGGNGGNAEISGYEFLGYEGFADLSAENGEVGSLLLDPEFAVIHSGILNNPLGLGYVLSAQALANSMEAANITVQADNFIDVGTQIDAYNTGNAVVDAILNGLVGTGDIDLSTYNYSQLEQTGTGSFFGIPFPIFSLVNYNGITAGGITLQSDAVNFNKDVIMGDGNLGVDANTVNLGSRLYDKDGTTTLGDARLFSNAGEVNVLSSAALIQQGVYLADDAGGATVNVAAGTYNESIAVDKAVKLLGANAGTDGNDAGRAAESIVMPNSPGFLVTANGVTIDGFKVDGNNASGSVGVNIEGATGTTVKNNVIDNTSSHAVRFANSETVTIANNDINRSGNAIMGALSSDITISDNSITRTSADGVAIVDSSDIDITGNDIFATDGDGVELTRSSDINIDDNIIDLLGGNVNLHSEGVELFHVENVTVTENEIRNVDQNGLRALHVTGDTRIHDNIIDNVGANGISIEDFDRAWISYNDISLTGGHGVNAVNGDFVSIYDNYIELSGYASNAPASGNTEVNSNADGIHVANIRGDNIPAIDTEITGFGSSTYGANVEIYGNDVSIATDDGIQVYDSDTAYIADNLIGHTGGRGINASHSGSVVASGNVVTMTEGRGINISHIDDYVGVFDNRVLGTGDRGIDVAFVGQNGAPAMTSLTADSEGNYESGWAVYIADNEVAMTADHGINVAFAGPTKIKNNSVFMAGMGEDFGDVVETINRLASSTAMTMPMFATRVAIAPPPMDEFTWQWGDGHGINVFDVSGAYNSPNGWAVDIRGNDVKYTGGHGINVRQSDRTRIKNNDVRYAGLDETTFIGQYSMLSTLGSGPFDRNNPGRRNLWADSESMIDVLEEYFGVEEPEEAYVSLDNITYDNHDGIHVEDVFNYSNEGISEANYLFALKIKNNDIKYTGDDGIEVEDSGRTLIAKNKIRDAGYGGTQDYGSGGYDGADGIRVTNVTAPAYGGVPVRASGAIEEPPVEEGYNYEPDENYALIIRENDIKRTGDDGIEVVGGENIMRPVPKSNEVVISGNNIKSTDEHGIILLDEKPEKEKSRYYGPTDRVLIAENTVEETGYFDNEFDIPEPGREHGYENVGPDGYGHDGIHVRNINGQDGDVWTMAAGNAGNAGGGNGLGFYGYAVDVIDNDVRKTGDDGIEVFNSDSTLILGNTVRKSGVYWDGKDNPNTDGADYYGADGIHVRNVGGDTEQNMEQVKATAGSGEGGNGYIDPYAVAIVDNDVRKTADDGIEVVGENEGNGGWNPDLNIVTADWTPPTHQYNGTGRTLILANTIRDAGVSGAYGNGYGYDYDSRTGGISHSYGYGNQGSYDGHGGDGIHIRGVGEYNDGQTWWPTDIDIAGASGGCGNGGCGGGDNYAVKIIENDVERTGDDGIEIVGNNFNDNFQLASLSSAGFNPSENEGGRVLIENNIVRDSGLSGGDYEYRSYNSSGNDKGGSYSANGYNYNYDYFGNAGDDGYGADGIHVRGIGGSNNNWVMSQAAGNAGNAGNGNGYYNYAVDILGNDVRRTGDDGIEVRDSESTLIVGNNVKNAGMLTSGEYSNSYISDSMYGDYSSESTNERSWTGGNNDEGSYSGGDGIHVENVGQNIRLTRGAGNAGNGNGNGFVDYAVVISDNIVKKSADDGIEVLYSGRTRIDTNTVTKSGIASYQGSGGSTNTSYPSMYDSTYSNWEEGSYEGAESHDRRGSDGIHVGGVEAVEVHFEENTLFINSSRENSVEIVGNTVDKSADDGIQVADSGTTLIEANTVSNSGLATSYGDEENGGAIGLVSAAVQVVDENTETYEFGGKGSTDFTGGDGINVSRDRLDRKGPPRPRIFALNEVISEEPEEPRFDVKIIGNTVTNSDDDGIEVIGSMYRSTNVLVDINDVTNSGDNGIALLSGSPFFDKKDIGSSSVTLISAGAPMSSTTTGNTVVDSGSNGLFVAGPSHNQVVVSGNTFTGFDIGAHFESGEIDLTGAGNVFNGGRIGMRFAPAETMPYYDHYKVSVFAGVPEPTFADMSLVGNTIGAQTFNGQGSFFVELDNGAFFDPGTPTVLRENDSTFVGTPFGTFTPSVDYVGGYPPAVLAYLESKFFHYNDDSSLGLFFLEPLLASIAQERVFNTFDPFDGGLGGLNVTLLGLPNVPGAPAGAALNNITPAAGGAPTPAQLNNIETAAGGEETDPEALNEIETAAGGEEASCWSDALNVAGFGQATTLNYDGSAEDLLNGEASCGTNI